MFFDEERRGWEEEARGGLTFYGEKRRGREEETRVRKRIIRVCYEDDMMSEVLLTKKDDQDCGSSITDRS